MGIVLYLDIYIAPLTAKTKQRHTSVHFSSREKTRLETRERDEERGRERIEEQRGGGSRFQREGPIDAKDRVWAIVVLERGRERSLEEQIGQREEV